MGRTTSESDLADALAAAVRGRFLLRRYDRWIYRRLRPFIGQRVLEVGCGLGNFTPFLLDRELVVAIDLSQEYCAAVAERFNGAPNLIVQRHDITADPRPLLLYNFDTVVCFNVLEHIADDLAALRNIYRVLRPGGALVLLVPALPALYGSLDAAIGHWRRYRRQELMDKATQVHFTPEKCFYINLLAALGWLVSGKLLRLRITPSLQLRFFDLLVPFCACLEALYPPPAGLSLVLIARK
ncbi:MAG: class I SAM-dependent methyltransferase [Anaerolineae bacterium]|nr:class I SAM-dependent methyltransferase [Anaerolineae bacterium]